MGVQVHLADIDFEFRNPSHGKASPTSLDSSRTSVVSYTTEVRSNVMYISNVRIWVNSLSEEYIRLFVEDQILLCERCDYEECHILLSRFEEYAQKLGVALTLEGFTQTPSTKYKGFDVYSYSLHPISLYV